VIHHLPPNGSVIQSVAFPPHAKGSIMPRIDIPLDPSLNSIVRPPCAKCDGQMMFTGIVSGPEGVDIRTFECVSCDSPSRPTRWAGSHSAGSDANLTTVWVRIPQRAVSSQSSTNHPRRCQKNLWR
jgi:hypothetical protein